MEVDNNKFSAEGAEALADVFSKIPVSKINLVKNNISTEGAKSLAWAMATNLNLTQVYLSNNNISDEGI
mgnify:CR=1 FL=1